MPLGFTTGASGGGGETYAQRLSRLANGASTGLYNTSGSGYTAPPSAPAALPRLLSANRGALAANAASTNNKGTQTAAAAAPTPANTVLQNSYNALHPAANPMAAKGGTGLGFTTGTANNGTEPMNGWAAGMGYTPADIMGMNQMPARYLYDILKNRGQDPTGGLFYMMEPLADVMMPLFETIYGGGRDITKGFETNEIANFMGQMFGEYMTPGGRNADVSELFGHLLSPGGDNSILNSYLNTGTPEEQVENFRRYAMMAGQLSGSPMYQQALSNRLSERGYDYLNSFQGGQQPTNTFGQLVQNPNY